eukprot:11204033-Lingulodinium_polyedra.AAC.1
MPSTARREEARCAAVPELHLPALRRRFADGQARAGLRPADPALLAMAQVAQGVDPELPQLTMGAQRGMRE